MQINNQHTELDNQLQQMAATDWNAFVELVGINCIMSAKICILRSKGRSWNQIAMKLHATKGSVRYKAESCRCS